MTELSKSILDFLLPAIEAHQRRRFMSAPETTIYPDDRFFDWAEQTIYGNDEVCVNFITKTTKTDMDALFAALTDDLWPAHRRAFASKFHQLAMELDQSGLEVTEGFAQFYRERYDPSYMFHVEKPAIPAGTAVEHFPQKEEIDYEAVD